MFTSAERAALEEKVVAWSQQVRDLEKDKKETAAGYNATIRETRKMLDGVLDALKSNDPEQLVCRFGEKWEERLGVKTRRDPLDVIRDPIGDGSTTLEVSGIGTGKPLKPKKA